MYSNAYLIKFLLQKENYQSYYDLVPSATFDNEYLKIFSALKEYHDTHETASWENFQLWYLANRYPELPDSTKELHTQYLKQIDVCEIGENVSEIVPYFLAQKTRRELLDILKVGYNPQAISKALEQYNEGVEKLNARSFGEYVNNDLDDIFKVCSRKEGLKWRLSFLNENLGRLINGDFLVVAAYVNSGKTSFLASEGAYMASQLPNEKSLLWFNNEGPEERILSRIWTSVCGISEEVLFAQPERSKEFYKKVMGGDFNKIKVFNATFFSADNITKIANKYNCGLIIIDQLDNVAGFGKQADMEIIRFKKLYQWARGLAKNRCPVLVSTQGIGTYADKNGEMHYKKYIGLSQLDGSRIAKQAAADFIITIGKDENTPNSRYLLIAKSKSGVPKADRAEVQFLEKISRYVG